MYLVLKYYTLSWNLHRNLAARFLNWVESHRIILNIQVLVNSNKLVKSNVQVMYTELISTCTTLICFLKTKTYYFMVKIKVIFSSKFLECTPYMSVNWTLSFTGISLKQKLQNFHCAFAASRFPANFTLFQTLFSFHRQYWHCFLLLDP